MFRQAAGARCPLAGVCQGEQAALTQDGRHRLSIAPAHLKKGSSADMKQAKSQREIQMGSAAGRRVLPSSRYSKQREDQGLLTRLSVRIECLQASLRWQLYGRAGRMGIKAVWLARASGQVTDFEEGFCPAESIGKIRLKRSSRSLAFSAWSGFWMTLGATSKVNIV